MTSQKEFNDKSITVGVVAARFADQVIRTICEETIPAGQDGTRVAAYGAAAIQLVAKYVEASNTVGLSSIDHFVLAMEAEMKAATARGLAKRGPVTPKHDKPA